MKKANKTNIVPINVFQTNVPGNSTINVPRNSTINVPENKTPRRINSTSRRQVVKGRGYTTATPAIPQLREHTESSKQKKVWKVLLFDSSFDGDIAFIKRSKISSIEMQN